jgi:hypothetical protein
MPKITAHQKRVNDFALELVKTVTKHAPKRLDEGIKGIGWFLYLMGIAMDREAGNKLKHADAVDQKVIDELPVALCRTGNMVQDWSVALIGKRKRR